MIVNSAGGQLRRENQFALLPFVHAWLSRSSCARELGLAVPFRVSPLILHARTKPSVALTPGTPLYLHSTSRFEAVSIRTAMCH